MADSPTSTYDPFKHALFGTQQKKPQDKKPKQFVDYKNPWEAVPDFKDTIKNQLFGGKKSGDLTPGQEIHLGAQQKAEPPKHMENRPAMPRPAMDYVGEILKSNEKGFAEDAQKVKQEIQNVVIELKNLAASTKNLEQEIMQATGNTVVNPGVYHKNFFQHVLSIVRDARQRVDSSGSWLRAMKGKRPKGMMGGGKQKKKQDYWEMAEKHGTKFTMSGERGVSTQTG